MMQSPSRSSDALASAELIHRSRDARRRDRRRWPTRSARDYAGAGAGVPDRHARRHAVRRRSWRWRSARAASTSNSTTCMPRAIAARPRGRRLAWMHRPATPLAGRRVLLVDDILDEGHTLKAVRAWCVDQGAADVRIAVLAVKRARPLRRRHLRRLRRRRSAGPLRVRLRHGLPRAGPQPAGDLRAEGLNGMTTPTSHSPSSAAPASTSSPSCRTSRRTQPVTRLRHAVRPGPRRHARRAGASPSWRAMAKAIRLPPHQINYRANLAALQALGATRVLALNTVGGITRRLRPARAGVPGPADRLHLGPHLHALRGARAAEVLHVDFGDPYTPSLRARSHRGRARDRRRAGRRRLLRRDPGAAPGNQGRDRAHAPRRLRPGRHDRHARSRRWRANSASTTPAWRIVANWAAGCGAGDGRGHHARRRAGQRRRGHRRGLPAAGRGNAGRGDCQRGAGCFAYSRRASRRPACGRTHTASRPGRAEYAIRHREMVQRRQGFRLHRAGGRQRGCLRALLGDRVAGFRACRKASASATKSPRARRAHRPPGTTRRLSPCLRFI